MGSLTIGKLELHLVSHSDPLLLLLPLPILCQHVVQVQKSHETLVAAIKAAIIRSTPEENSTSNNSVAGPEQSHQQKKINAGGGGGGGATRDNGSDRDGQGGVDKPASSANDEAPTSPSLSSSLLRTAAVMQTHQAMGSSSRIVGSYLANSDEGAGGGGGGNEGSSNGGNANTNVAASNSEIMAASQVLEAKLEAQDQEAAASLSEAATQVLSRTVTIPMDAPSTREKLLRDVDEAVSIGLANGVLQG